MVYSYYRKQNLSKLFFVNTLIDHRNDVEMLKTNNVKPARGAASQNTIRLVKLL